jgi:hypothetical protein
MLMNFKKLKYFKKIIKEKRKEKREKKREKIYKNKLVSRMIINE